MRALEREPPQRVQRPRRTGNLVRALGALGAVGALAALTCAPAGCSAPTQSAAPGPDRSSAGSPTGAGGDRSHAVRPVRYDAHDPATWSNRALAAQLVMAPAALADPRPVGGWVRMGVGGILLSGPVPADLGARLTRLRSAAAVPPLVASNEEGGSVQRLTKVIYPLPSAATMGRLFPPERIRQGAAQYGGRMKALHVDVDLAPDADLAVPGSFIASDNRAFSADPAAAGRDAAAVITGLLEAGVLPVVKHWPGHGHATDTHTGAARVPALSVLERRDLRAFEAAFAAGAPAVMVGHLIVPGLTEPGLPASLSPAAYRYLRAQAGPGRLVLTDSMSMGATTAAVGLDTTSACVRALQAGADMVVLNTGNPVSVVSAIAAAIDAGTYPRSGAVAAAERILAAKRLVWG